MRHLHSAIVVEVGAVHHSDLVCQGLWNKKILTIEHTKKLEKQQRQWNDWNFLHWNQKKRNKKSKENNHNQKRTYASVQVAVPINNGV